MPFRVIAGRTTWSRRSRRDGLVQWAWWIVGTAAFVMSARFISEQTVWWFVLDAPRQALDLFSRMIPPDWAYSQRLWKALWDTVNIATLGTIFALIVAIPNAFLAARNTTPHPLLRQMALLIIAVSRSVNALIWALILVTVIGPGMLAGILAIGLRAVGFISKLLYEAIEEVNATMVEAVVSTGASKGQVLSYAIVPQVLPALIGITVFRWDINIRASTVLGLVGAGGIGLQLNAAVSSMNWNRASMIFILIFALVLFSEWISAKARNAVT